MAGIYDSPDADVIGASLQRRLGDRMAGRSDDAVRAYLADAVYQERRRFAAAGHLNDEDRAEQRAVEEASRAIHSGRDDAIRALLALADRYAHEIHNRFSHRTHRVATQVIPGALTRLLTAAHPGELFGADFDPASRLQIVGDGDRLRRLAERYTLILAPTHLSNLDSPILGYALHNLGLPPFIYGAGLNLFGNKLMGFFMSRLGAYTVDRRKRHGLYKDALKDYSIDALGRRCHSLFFPGGTRARSGQVEKKLKMGLLGTGITAWQDGLENRREDPEILVVPCTLSFALTLEADTLIEDALAEAGKARYIITDDEFSEPRAVASFARRVLNLDSSVYVVLGEPLDLLGNPVDEEGQSVDVLGQVVDRRRYVCDRNGAVIRDVQRDRQYTRQLSDRLVSAFHRENLVQSTHLAAYAGWWALRGRHPGRDTWQLMFTSPAERRVPRADVLARLDRVLGAVNALAAKGRIRVALPERSGGQDLAEVVLNHAVDRFSDFHHRRALAPGPDRTVEVDPRLTLFYGNRLVGYELESIAKGAGS